MTVTDMYGLSGVLLVLAVAVFTISNCARRFSLHPELARKALHVSMGLVTLSFPRVFSGIFPVLLLALASSGYFLAVHRWRAMAAATGLSGPVLARSSRGEFYFIFGVYITLWLAPSPFAYTIAILVLSLADAAAAVTGLYYGRSPYRIPHGFKTLEGSVIFFLVAMLTTGWLLTSAGTYSGVQWWQTTISVALAATMTEALLARGLDNLMIPITVLFALEYLASFPLTVLIPAGLIGLSLLYLARISHHHPTTRTDPPTVTGRTPSGRFDVSNAAPSVSPGSKSGAGFSPCGPLRRRIRILAVAGGEKYRPGAGHGPIRQSAVNSSYEKPAAG